LDQRLGAILERLRRALDAEDILHQIDGCISCGNCGTACPWYLSSEDPLLHPARRADLVRRIYRNYIAPSGGLRRRTLRDAPHIQEIDALKETVWKCNSCGRCTLACPMGISNRRLFLALRSALTVSGTTLPGLQKAREMGRQLHHTLGLGTKEAMKWVDMAGEEGVEVPVDEKGKRYLLLPSFAETGKLPEALVNTAKLLDRGGVSYTTSSAIQDGGAEVHQAMVDPELGREYIELVEGEAEDLGCETVMIAECGCDARTWLVEAPAFLGRQLSVKTVLAGQVIHRLYREGRLSFDPGATRETVTYHDPCYVTRLTGWMEEPRELLGACASRFVEMEPNREYNYCCMGGAGPLRISDFEEARLEASRFKAEQIKATGAAIVTAPCATCVLSLRTIIERYDLPCRAVPLSELLVAGLQGTGGGGG